MSLADKLVDDAADWWRWASTWASGTGIGILAVWNMMPFNVRYLIPDWALVIVGVGLWGLVLAARIWKQPTKEPSDG
jgi:hypothetical protein